MPRLLFAFALLALAVPAFADEAIIRTAKNGAWSAADTWQGGKVPGQGAKVLILPEHAVTYDVKSDAVIRAISVGGTLRFARDRDTLLNVGLIKLETSSDYSEEGFDCDAHLEEIDASAPRATLEVGSAREPIPAKFTAKIRLHYVEGLDKGSCPAIVCCGGRMDFHGAPMNRTWVKLGATANKGESTVTLAEAVTGWKPGDKVIVTTTDEGDTAGGRRRPGQQAESKYTEERTIKAIDGVTLTLDAPLNRVHRGEGDLRGEVANLSRNVIVESADPAGVRGHTMYHKGSAGSISYAEFRHLGKENVLGRYSLHFHLVGNTMRGSYVIGASIWDSHNRWLTIHGTNYLVVRDNVGFQSVGHGFFMEDGTEVFNVIDRNLAVQAFHGKRLPKQVLPFDANEGAGFWWANSLNTFTRNVACENERYGYRFEATPSSSFDIKSPEVMKPDGTLAKTDIRTLPLVKFDQNECHSDGLYGVNLGEGVNRVGPDTKHPFIMTNTKIWNVHYALRAQSPNLLCENLHIEDAVYGVYHPNFDNYVFKNVKILTTESEPFNRGHDDLSEQYGPLTVDGLEFSSKYFGGGMPFIQISDDNPTGKGVSHFRNVTVRNQPPKSRRALVDLGGGPQPEPKTKQGVTIYIHDWYGPGKHAKVVSVKSGEYKAAPNDYKSDPPLTGEKSRVAETTGIDFPKLLDPVDDLPPQTIITSIEARGDKLLIKGIASDNGDVKRVLVNGEPATLAAGGLDWQVEIARAEKVTAVSEDAAGNVEKLPHAVVVK
jgi:hypothetical protein